ncbi:FAD-dependent oxidoreductase [Wenzhouxiangella marina]|uniref:Uncharacterized protein n=1 Tax=Wenzhouxiangella marina TaxID=1579979 RepID=A0A0K0XZQ6_9GAMM|nr:GMC family oxidoreductase [Wenzhouxiangella marina]AKS43168.1 hypothetical protein WM2015_2811 [Wenzhouxiangella marina]MBB6087147.1 choline dehydrogenase-like flavoprotein [Wenzhouxiangella marina]
MIHDARQTLPSELEAEVCIAGAGPAGIVLALELAARGRQVLLIEGGGVDSPGDGQSIYDGEVTGRAYPLLGSRLRWLGGTSNHWGGWVKPFDPVDFEDKPHFPLPGWPMALDTLQPWYRTASEWCELDDHDFSMDALSEAERERLMPLSPESGFEHRLFRFSPPTRFGRRYRDALTESPGIECWTELNAVELEQGEDRVRALRCRTLGGGECRVRAAHFVLAMGGIENARFLLNQSQVPGNQAGLVGRCFMDHYGFSPGGLLGSESLAYERGALPGRDVMVVMSSTNALVQEFGLRNSCIMLNADEPDALLAPDYWSSPLLGDGPGGMRRIGMINEPLPHPESGLSLSEERDAIGLRRARLNWHLPPSEFEPVLALFEHWARAVSAAGLARVRQTRRDPTPLDAHVGIGYHHMGTTRMSATPEFGVTDAQGRCWDRDNLYLAGSSLFPHAGYSNPTLTIVALAARLAEHLDQRLGEAG